jgi:hypothetical protein
VTTVRLLPPGREPPAEHRTRDGLFRRQRLSDAEADYEAVMASKESLRVWCDDTWPEDGFTLADNLADLEGHLADAAAGTAFGYTIWDTSGERVLGSLYLEPTGAFLGEYDLDEATRVELATFDVRVECWLRDGIDEATEGRLLDDIRGWLTEAWPFERPCWGSRRGMTRRRALLESLGFSEVAVLRSRDGARRFHLHADRGR